MKKKTPNTGKPFKFKSDDWNPLAEQKRKAKYRWEFMRRDPEYIAAYEAILDFCTMHEGTVTPDVLEEISRICREFGIKAMIDPTKGFNDLDEKERSYVMDAAITSVLIHSSSIMKGLGLEENLTTITKQPISDKIGGQDILTIQIDFSRINSIDYLKRYVARAIDDHMFISSILNPESGRGIIKDVEFDSIIQAGDLQAKLRVMHQRPEGKFYRELRDDRTAANKEAAKKRVKRLCENYESLTRGGYRGLSFP